MVETSAGEVWKVCAVCGYTLLREVNVGWKHGPRDSDHVAVPVDITEIEFNQRCDFCCESPGEWAVTAESFTIPDTPMASRGPWMACERCVSFVRVKKWTSLASYVLRTNQAMSHGHPSDLLPIYRQLEMHMHEIISMQEYRERISSSPPRM